MKFETWWNNDDRDETSNHSIRNNKYNTAKSAWNWRDKEITQLKKQLEAANEVISFYGEENNYYKCHRINSPVSDGCGKRAREYQKEWGIK